MAYGSVLTDTVQSSTAGTPTTFKDGNGTQIGTLCRAWVRFTAGTGATIGAFNVSSVTRAGAGRYTVNFITAMPDVNYAPQVTLSYSILIPSYHTPITTTSVAINSDNSGGVPADAATVAVSVFR